MNVLILTPDRVGSTLLQRLITVYMNFHKFDRPVINLHELTNGLIKYYSPLFNNEILNKPNNGLWGYHQSLQEITELLNSVDHYKTSRLAHYHIQNRKDTIADQLPFYQYLNDNFFIISAQRQNLLEHALSWCINTHSKKLNVYTHQEKIDKFAKIYTNRITVDVLAMTKYLDKYVAYLNWVEDHFSVASYFEYNTHMPCIEQYILGLDIFGNQHKKTWSELFDIDFQDWNRCHYLTSDLSGISAQLSSSSMRRIEFDSHDQFTGMELMPVTTKTTILNSLSVGDKKFLHEHASKYVKAYQTIDQLIKNNVIISGIPIKLQTMLEKRKLIRNFDQCVETYNSWVYQHGVGNVYTDQDLDQQSINELGQWHDMPRLI